MSETNDVPTHTVSGQEPLETLMDPAPDMLPITSNCFRCYLTGELMIIEYYFIPESADGSRIMHHSIKPVARIGVARDLAESILSTLGKVLHAEAHNKE